MLDICGEEKLNPSSDIMRLDGQMAELGKCKKLNYPLPFSLYLPGSVQAVVTISQTQGLINNRNSVPTVLEARNSSVEILEDCGPGGCFLDHRGCLFSVSSLGRGGE